MAESCSLKAISSYLTSDHPAHFLRKSGAAPLAPRFIVGQAFRPDGRLCCVRLESLTYGEFATGAARIHFNPHKAADSRAVSVAL
jgi:hypothetical protein